MATMFRVSIPNGGPATVSTSVAALSTCEATELAVIVGDSVARQRCGSELREALKAWARAPKTANGSVGGTNRLTYVGAPGVPGDQLAAATPAQATAPDEAQWGVVLGATAATDLDKSDVMLAAVQRAIDAFPAQLGL